MCSVCAVYLQCRQALFCSDEGGDASSSNDSSSNDSEAGALYEKYFFVDTIVCPILPFSAVMRAAMPAAAATATTARQGLWTE
jgi:hypothetical protein